MKKNAFMILSLFAVIFLIGTGSFIFLVNRNFVPALMPVISQTNYYGRLAAGCSDQRSDNCCMVSVESMRMGGYQLEHVEGCSVGFQRNSLWCNDSYRWCQPSDTADPSSEALAKEGWKTYINETYGFEIKIPKDWFFDNGISPIIHNYNYDKTNNKAELDNYVKIDIYKENASYSGSLKDYVNTIILSDNRYENHTIKEDSSIGNIPAIEFIRKEEDGFNSPKFFIIKNSDSIYRIAVFLNYKANKEVVDEILSTFKFTQ